MLTGEQILRGNIRESSHELFFSSFNQPGYKEGGHKIWNAKQRVEHDNSNGIATYLEFGPRFEQAFLPHIRKPAGRLGDAKVSFGDSPTV